MGARVSLFREPDAGKLPVRFDEREQETELGQTGLRGRGESPVTSPPGDYFYCACSRLYSPYHSSSERADVKRIERTRNLSVKRRLTTPDFRVARTAIQNKQM